MSERLERMSNAMALNKIPADWMSQGFPSLKSFLSWVADFRSRLEFMHLWVSSSSDRQPAYPISYFFFPQGFLTVVKQTHARRYSIPINTLAFSTSVMAAFRPESVTAPSNGVNIYGIFLQGAIFNTTSGLMEDAFAGNPLLQYAHNHIGVH